jgi:hypothetical protein
VTDLLVDAGREADAAWLGEAFQARRHIHPIAVDVTGLDDDVAHIDPDAQGHGGVLGRPIVACDQVRLHRDRTAHRIHRAREFDQRAVARGLDDAPVVFGDPGVEELCAQGLEALERALLVRAHQSRVAYHVSGQDSGEAALHRNPP